MPLRTIRFFQCLAIALPAIPLMAQSTQLTAGVYYMRGTAPIKMAEAPTPTVQIQSLGAFLLDPVNNGDVRYDFEGSDSPVVVSERRPTFRVNLGFQPDRELRRVEIIRLRKKNGYRRAQLPWKSTSYKGSVAAVIRQDGAGQFEVTPAADLEAGEYLLSLGPQAMKFDFSVR